MSSGDNKIDMIIEILAARSVTAPISTADYVGTNVSMLEKLIGIKSVDIYFYEPDPSTYKYDYYYNSRLNKLFRKMSIAPIPVWKPIS